MDPSQDDFTVEIHKRFKKLLIPTIHNLSLKIEKEETISISFFEANVTLKANPE